MPMTPHAVASALLAAALLASAPAHAAEGHFSADISGFQYELIDLDLTDNITPSLSFTYIDRQVASFYNEELIAPQNPTLHTYGSTAVTRPDGSTSASLAATALNSTTDLVHTSPKWVNYESKAESFEMFTLSPNTGLMVTALGKVSADNQGLDYGMSSIFLYVALYSNENDVDGYRYFAHGHSTSNGARDYSMSGYLASGSAAETGVFSLKAATRTYTYPDGVTPVPEPETWGMLLTGGLLVGAVARRRRRR